MRRRTLLAGAGLLGVAGSVRAPAPASAETAIARSGFAAVSAGTRFTRNPDTRFAMCSTFKLPLAGAILHEVDRGRLRLDDAVRFGRSDLVPYAPVVEAHLASGALSVEALCAAAVTFSDNVAANLLLQRIGGPEGMTAFFRKIGDTVSRLDRWEPELNSNRPDDPRDTTTPAAMLHTMEQLLTGDLLAPASRERLIGWLVACRTGLNRLRAGFPPEWRAGDKTGTSGNGAVNDLAIAWPSTGASPILIACYTDVPNSPATTVEQHFAEVGRRAAAALG